MSDEVNGYDDGYRHVPVIEPQKKTYAYLLAYVKGVRDRLIIDDAISNRIR